MGSDDTDNETEVTAGEVRLRGKASDLLPLVYQELRRLAAVHLAREEPGQTLDPTGLVHEAYIRLMRAPGFSGKSHFFRAAAEAMRRILVDNARHKRTLKRGAGAHRFELSESDRVTLPDSDTLLTIDEALSQLLLEDPTSAEVARLRLFAGLSIDEAADLLGISRATAFRDWQFARAVLTAALRGETNSANP
jgi:RNA polymerase sigma factor (TIGR02999 family)